MLNGLEHLADTLRKGLCTVLGIAPLTTLARIIELYPECAANIERIYFLGGRFERKDDEPIFSHNVCFDPLAAQAVFDSEIPLTLVQSDVASQFTVARSICDKLVSKEGGYVAHMIEAFRGYSIVRELHSLDYAHRLRESVNAIMQDKVKGIKRGTSEQTTALLQARNEYDGIIEELGDSAFAQLDPKRYHENYNALIAYLRSSTNQRCTTTASMLEQLASMPIRASDACVPYAAAFPERIETRPCIVRCDEMGQTYLEEGNVHQIVTGIDKEHFRAFLTQRLR